MLRHGKGFPPVSVLILMFAMRGTVISATSERPAFTADRAQEKHQYGRPAESQLNQRDLAKPLSFSQPVYRRISASGAQMASSHKRKVIRAAEQEQNLAAFSAKNNAERITEQSFVHEDAASTSDVIRQLSENVDYDEEVTILNYSLRKEWCYLKTGANCSKSSL